MDFETLRLRATGYSRRALHFSRGVMALATESIEKMLPLIFTPLGRIGGTLAIIAVAWFGFAKHYEKKGASRVAEKIERSNNANVQKAETARRAVDDIPDGGLRDRYRRD